MQTRQTTRLDKTFTMPADKHNRLEDHRRNLDRKGSTGGLIVTPILAAVGLAAGIRL